MKKRKLISILFIMLLIIISGCQEKELSELQKPYVVADDYSLPYYTSKQEYNSKPVNEIISQLSSYDRDESYILVDNEGNIMRDEEFVRKNNREFAEELDMAHKVKNYPLFIVHEDSFYITSVEKEIKALFSGDRILFKDEGLEKIKSDNKEAYKKKDYQVILNYLNKNNIKVWKH